MYIKESLDQVSEKVCNLSFGDIKKLKKSQKK